MGASTVNVLLHLTDLGWREQTAATVLDNLRVEGLLGSGAVDNEAEAERIAAAELARYSTPTRSDVVTLEPVDANDTPFISHHEGQTVDLAGEGASDVESVAFDRDRDGHVTYAVELFGHIDTLDERYSRAQRAMIDGTLAGTSKVAQPTHTRPQADQFRPAVPEGDACCRWAANLTAASSDNISQFGSDTITLTSPDGITGGMLYPSDPGLAGDLPAGVIHVAGYVDVTFASAPSLGGDVFVQYVQTTAAADPATIGGYVRGLQYVNGSTRLSVPFSGDILEPDLWTPTLTVTNGADQDIDSLFIFYTANGQDCPCEMGTTSPGG